MTAAARAWCWWQRPFCGRRGPQRWAPSWSRCDRRSAGGARPAAAAPRPAAAAATALLKPAYPPPCFGQDLEAGRVPVLAVSPVEITYLNRGQLGTQKGALRRFLVPPTTCCGRKETGLGCCCARCRRRQDLQARPSTRGRAGAAGAAAGRRRADAACATGGRGLAVWRAPGNAETDALDAMTAAGSGTAACWGGAGWVLVAGRGLTPGLTQSLFCCRPGSAARAWQRPPRQRWRLASA